MKMEMKSIIGAHQTGQAWDLLLSTFQKLSGMKAAWRRLAAQRTLVFSLAAAARASSSQSPHGNLGHPPSEFPPMARGTCLMFLSVRRLTTPTFFASALLAAVGVRAFTASAGHPRPCRRSA